MQAYYASEAGVFGHYFVHSLTSCGSLNCTYSLLLGRFYFFEDSGTFHLLLRHFMTAFVESNYTSSETLKLTAEIEIWLLESTEGAKVVEFPKTLASDQDVLVDVLTRFALLGVVHKTLNGGDPVSSTLPFHSASLHTTLSCS